MLSSREYYAEPIIASFIAFGLVIAIIVGVFN